MLVTIFEYSMPYSTSYLNCHPKIAVRKINCKIYFIYSKLIVKYINLFLLLGILKVTLVYVVVVMFGMNYMGLSTYRGGSLQHII